MRRQWSIDPRATGNQIYLMPFKGFTDFKAPEEMADPQYMLAVVDDFHGVPCIFSIGRISLTGSPCMCRTILEIIIFLPKMFKVSCGLPDHQCDYFERPRNIRELSRLN
jgi:hypothetical protein